MSKDLSQTAYLLLLEYGKIRVAALNACEEWLIGRSGPQKPEQSSILFQSPIVSRKHGRFCCLDGQWYYVENPENRNGTFYNGKKIPKARTGRKRPVLLESGDILRIDGQDLNQPSPEGVMMLFSVCDIQGPWKSQRMHSGRPLYIQCADASQGSACAEISQINGQYCLTASSASQDVLINGSPPGEKASPLREKDCITLMGEPYLLSGDRLYFLRKKGCRTRLSRLRCHRSFRSRLHLPASRSENIIH